MLLAGWGNETLRLPPPLPPPLTLSLFAPVSKAGALAPLTLRFPTVSESKTRTVYDHTHSACRYKAQASVTHRSFQKSSFHSSSKPLAKKHPAEVPIDKKGGHEKLMTIGTTVVAVSPNKSSQRGINTQDYFTLENYKSRSPPTVKIPWIVL